MRSVKRIKTGLCFCFLLILNLQNSFAQQDSSSQFITNQDSSVSITQSDTTHQKKDSLSQDSSVKNGVVTWPRLDSAHQKSLVPINTKGNLSPAAGLLSDLKIDSARRNNLIPITKNKIKVDSTTAKKLLKKLIPKTTGSISAGYDYGIIPFAANIKYPMGYFSSQGNVGFSLLGIPLSASYYYSDLKSVSGLNNYFRISFDQSSYKKLTSNKSFEKIDEEKDALSSLNHIKQQLIQKLTFSQMMQSGLPSTTALNTQLTDYTNKVNTDKYKNLNEPSFRDSLKISLPDSSSDSMKIKPKIPKESTNDSISTLTNLIHKNDSISKKIEYYSDALQKIEQQIRSINNKLQLLKDPQKVTEENHYMRKAQSLMSGIKKLEIGLCYPNYSTFLVSGSTIKGINVEWEKKFYVAFTYGKTINTVMTTNNIIQNQLQMGRNLYNFFDFTNVKDSRKIAALKFGYGKKESTHLFAGFLYGVGLPSYLGQIPQAGVEKNLVIEIDGKIAINKSNTVEVIYGKSTLYQSGIPINSDASQSDFPFSNNRSNSGQIKYISEIKKTKTKLTAMGRIIDPFFTSYGVGFIRSDNLRYELKIDQEITKKIKFTGFYRKDRDNLLNTFSYTTQLQTMGATLSIKLDKRFVLKASYMPVIQNLTSKDTGLKVNHHVNNISNVIITYLPKLGKITSIFTAMYSYYDLSGTAGKSTSFQNYMISNNTTINTHFKNDFVLNYFQNNDNDSLNNSTFLFSNNLSYTSNNGSTITIGVKLAQNTLIKTQTGGIFKINFPLIKHIRLELMVEKLVLGDFYSSYNLEQIKKFPLYGYGKVIVSW